MKKIILGLVILSIGFTSCSDFLTEEPELKQSNELTLAKFKGLNNAISGAYSPLYSNSWYGANFILSSEIRAGNAKNPTITTFGSGRYSTEYSWNFTASSTSPLWNYAYYVISSTNNVLNNLEGKETSEVTEQDINNLRAEALFLRSLSYFDLVITYAQPYTSAPESPGVPLVYVSDVASKPSRNTVAEVYDQVVTDLTDAESSIAEDYTRSDAVDPAAVVSKSAIQALLSRVYLYKGEWQKSADYATKVINSGKFSLFTVGNYEEQWGQITATEGGEVIFEVYGSQKNSYWGSWETIPYFTSPKGYADVASTSDLRDLYEENDVRGKLFLGDEAAPDHYWTLKYPSKPGTNRENNTIVLRLSEMYLNRAESIFNGAVVSGVTADSDLKKITDNRGATAISATSTSIFNERRKELAFEGHIVYDYARTKKSLVRIDYQGASVNKDISFPSYKWALPIPKAELDANPNILQNENY